MLNDVFPMFSKDRSFENTVKVGILKQITRHDNARRKKKTYHYTIIIDYNSVIIKSNKFIKKYKTLLD